MKSFSPGIWILGKRIEPTSDQWLKYFAYGGCYWAYKELKNRQVELDEEDEKILRQNIWELMD